MSIEDLKNENDQLKTKILELQSQLTLMQTIFDSLSEGVVATNLEGEFLLANPSAENMAGMGPVEADPGEWSETYGTFYPDKVTLYPSTELPLHKAMRGETTNDIKLVLRNPNRPEGVFVSVSGRPLHDETGKLIGGVIAMRDVTELEKITKQLEITVNQLQNRNALMDAIFNSIGDGVVVTNKDGKYVMFNETAKEMGGYSLNNVHTKYAPETLGLFQLDGQELFPADELPLARALHGENSDNVEIIIRNSHLPHGMNASISARPIYNEKGVVTGAVAAVHDISELKQKEQQLETLNEQLAAQSEFMESIFNSISDGIIVTDSSGCVTFFNRSAHRIIGSNVASKEALQTWQREYEYFHLDGITPYAIEELPLMQAIQGKSTDNVEILVRSLGLQDEIYVRVSGRPLQNSDDTQKGGVVVFHDITDKVRSEEALAQAFTQGRLEIVDTVLHNIGNAINSVTVGIDTVHDMLADDLLSNRLTALANTLKQHEDNLSDYIENDPQGQKVLPFLLTLAHDFSAADAALRETIERIRNRAHHIVDIIRTQNAYHGTSGALKDINLAAAISDAIQIMQDSINKRQVHIKVDCENAPEEIRIQESQFHQVLVNLIKNAIEAIDELTEFGEPHEAPRIQIRAYINGDFLCLDVTDNGIGIAPEDLNKIFSAGFTTKEGGSGLGLHSSANFVISSGGKIQPLSKGKGKGSTIRILLRHSAISPDNHQE